MPPATRFSGFAPAVLAGIVLALAAPQARAQSHFEGDIGPGSSYEIDVPATWNGALVLYAHGLIQAGLPVAPPSALPEFAALRTALLSSGFALAASNLSNNGWALAEAVRNTNQLTGIFKSKVGAARRTFLMGASMGALVAVKLAETQAKQYDA